MTDPTPAARILRAAADAMTRAGWPATYGKHLRVAAVALEDDHTHGRDDIAAAVLDAAHEATEETRAGRVGQVSA